LSLFCSLAEQYFRSLEAPLSGLFPTPRLTPVLWRWWVLGTLLLCGLVTSALAQTWEVVGLVIDSQRGEPIIGVEISTKSGKVLNTTNSKGRFSVTVNNRGTTLVFRRQSYKDLEVDLATLTELIDVEISLESSALEVTEKTVTDTLILVKKDEKRQTIEELELMQGMRHDLNDHLRHLPGVSGMGEFSKDVSVYGSRSQDVTQYLGQSRIPNMRHLDIGFPGNLSVINPRVLKAVTMADNLSKGPVNQGNASALVFDLQDGDPDYVRTDLVLGTINREINMTGFWEGRTFLASARYLDSKFLKNLGLHFYTDPKEARLKDNGKPCDGECAALDNPFTLVSGDFLLSTFKRDSSGAFGRHSIIGLSDDYEANQDVGRSRQEAVAQTIVEGFQDAWMYAYEGVSPTAAGEDLWGVSLLRRNRSDTYKDTLAPISQLTEDDEPLPWYPKEGRSVTYLLGDWQQVDWQLIGSWQHDLNGKPFGAKTSLGTEVEYAMQTRDYYTAENIFDRDTLTRDMALLQSLYRLKWSLNQGRNWEAALGFQGGWDAPLQGEASGLITPMPLATVRYTHPFQSVFEGYAEAGMRQAVAFEPTGFNQLSAYATPSGEIKLGVNKSKGDVFRFTSALYARLYKDPALPSPEVDWNYAETQESDYAYARGVTGTATYLPNHHLGLFVNATWVDGDYHLENGSYLPWEMNRKLDLVGNMRILPRNDSLLSFIATYTVSQGAPLYQYNGLWDEVGFNRTLTRTMQQNTEFPTVSRQRLDIRINLDLKSKWKPLDNLRFFFEADNIFSEMQGTGAEWLGGANRRQRGWTRSNANGDLIPVVTRGLGLFIFFGVEGKLTLLSN
jgi:CarboxypepD_reg-like domain